MKDFARLYRCLDETTKTSRKVRCIRHYLGTASPADAAWAVYFLTGRKPKRLVRARDLGQWCSEETGIAAWMFDECHATVGDLAETIALLLDDPGSPHPGTLREWAERLLELRDLSVPQQRARIVEAWCQMDRFQRFVWNKLLTGEFRVGVSQSLVVRALSELTEVPTDLIALRLMGDWLPTPEFFEALTSGELADSSLNRPYPFCLAHPLPAPPSTLGDLGDWQAEPKWDGIRAQCLRRQGTTSLWTRGEELVTDRFPEVTTAAEGLPDGTVLDGEILAWKDEQVMPFSLLQRRIGRKTLGRKILADIPVRYLAFDLLERNGRDVRSQPLDERRRELESLLHDASSAIQLCPLISASSWEELAERRAQSRQQHVEGIMLKARTSVYGVGRVTGLWWKWKVDPYTIDAVLVYAQAGHGRRAGLFTDYTFALWHEGQLVPFAKAYSGLNDAEIREVDRFVREHTIDRFGPVRQVEPKLVFEIAFENIQLSSRHKSGIAVRFPRIVRWRADKTPAEADTLARIQALGSPGE